MGARTHGLLGVLWLASACAAAWAASAPPTPPGPPKPRDPYKDLYETYRPDFLRSLGGREWRVPEKKMRLSSERGFFTLNLIREDARANALAGAAFEREMAGQYRDALKMYQIIIDRYPRAMYRVSKYGVFVPISQYCQRRILNVPPEHLEHYRTVHDARAKEAFESARRKHSLIGLSEIVDAMLATSYGGRAILELGNASLDTGHYLAALERFTTICEFFPRPELRTPELNLKIAYCRRMLRMERREAEKADRASSLSPPQFAQLERVVRAAAPEPKPFHSQLASPPHATADDYTLSPATTDPMAIEPPVWTRGVPGSRTDFYVYTQPVVTENSVVYRHKNVVYCRSILTGEPRWVNKLGGRATWQRRLHYHQEDVLAQDGRVFTVIHKGGPSLVALDEVTGQLTWAYGPMVASTEEEARMRFETAPAGGPRTVYAGYILDNIEGDTHIDTEYGLIAFESTTGRIRWRTPLCRLTPGKFAAGFAVRRRNRIRSFVSPPLYHQGTVYYSTDAGAVAAVESLSGRVKWLFRYPYYHGVHDATRGFGRGHHYKYLDRPPSPMFWYGKHPLVVGEQLYVTPLDTGFLFCVERRTGRIRWTHPKAARGIGYFLGPNRKGELVLAYGGRRKYHRPDGWTSGPPIYLLNPKDGKVLWTAPDIITLTGRPVVTNLGVDIMYYCIGAQPFLSRDNRLYVPNFLHIGWPVFGSVQYLACVDLNTRKLVGYRRYYDGPLLGFASRVLHDPDFRWYAPRELKELEDLPHKDKKVRDQISWLKKIVADTVPANEHGPFMSFSRITFQRYGVPFELRFAPRNVSMVYDRPAVRSALEGRTGPAAEFAKAELSVADSRLDDAARRLRNCLARISSEDLDFRALIRQQLFRVHKRLARSAIRAAQPDQELHHALGMSRTASTLAEEIETLFALADAYERQEKPQAAARCLRSVINTYGHHEYPVAPIAAGADPRQALAAASAAIGRAERYATNPFFRREMTRSLGLSRKGLPLYVSTVSPLPKPLTVRAGELAAARLLRLRAASPEFRDWFGKVAEAALRRGTPEEQLYRLWEFPGTAAAQETLDSLFEDTAGRKSAAARQRRWELADVARVGLLAVPARHRKAVAAPPPWDAPVAVDPDAKERARDLADAEGINWLVLERRGDRSSHPELAYLGGRVRKRLDNKFVLACFNLDTGAAVWKREGIRLKGTGQEPGFFEAFAHRDLVVVHGLYDVLAFGAMDGTPRWRFRAPFNFEILHAVKSGDLLVLSGKTETLALYLPTESPVGEVAWQVKERGDIYTAPYFSGDRLITVRKMPFNVTVRYRATGRLIGRLELPDLSLHEKHPLIETGPPALPVARDGDLLVVTDGWYYIAVDTKRLRIRWKRLIDTNDLTREPAMRFTLRGDHLVVLKEDYDQKALYMLSSRTGEVRWHTDFKDPRSPQPAYSLIIRGDKAYGLMLHPGQGFHFVGFDCGTGKRFVHGEVKGYKGKPAVSLAPRIFGNYVVARVQSRQQFQLVLLDIRTGKAAGVREKKGAGSFGVHGRVSATVQNGRLVFLSKDKLSL